MRITDSDVIKNREKELLEMISGDLDRDVMRKMLSAKYQMELDGDSLVCRGGELVVHDNQVAYKIDYEAVVTLSLMFNRQGLCLEILPSGAGAVPGKKEGESRESGYYAYAYTGSHGEEVIPEGGHYAYACKGKMPDGSDAGNGEYAYTAEGNEADEVMPECGYYAYASPAEDTEELIPGEGEYAAAGPGNAAETTPAEENETRNAGPVGDPSSTRMASSIAEMIAEINKT